MRIVFVVGARPNFPKVAPILAALQGYDEVQALLCHTGQHYDPELSSMFFEDLGISEPDWLLGVGSGTHAVQTAKVMVAFEERCLADRPDAVVVLGDVNSTAACAMVAAKLLIPCAHVEAGLRSGDRTMPEEINRLVTDTLCGRLYTHCREADDNLRAEGIAEDRILMTGNVMIDTLLRMRFKAERPDIAGWDAKASEYGLVTLHRPALVDHEDRLRPMLHALGELSQDLPLLYPVHPRTMARMRSFGLLPEDSGDEPQVLAGTNITVCKPIRYLQFLWLMDHARLVLTDSGGIQEETTALAVPCITVRPNTERAVTVRDGTNTLVGMGPHAMLAAAKAALREPMPTGETQPELWDGQAGRRIAADLVAWLTD